MIIALAKSVLPFTSVTVKNTEFTPIFEQSNVDLLNVIVSIVQLSDEPLSTSEVVILPFPLASRLTVTACVKTVGLMISITVTKALAESTLPFTSVTIK